MGGGTRFLQAGSSLALECVVTHTRGPPPAVFWYRDSEVVDYDSPRGGISLEVGRNSLVEVAKLSLDVLLLLVLGILLMGFLLLV